MNTRLTTLLLLPLLSLSACVPRQYPPPATPTAALSQIPPAPPAPPGMGQVVLEVQDGPAQATAIVGSYQLVTVSRYGTSVTPGEIGQGLCVTPCVATLPYGNHDLRFTSLVDPERTSTASVMVAQQPSGYRHALGVYRPRAGARVGAYLLIALGLSAAVTGLTLSALSSSTDAITGMSSSSSAPLALGIGGGIAAALGIGLLIAFPQEFQPGSGVQFGLPGQGAAPIPTAGGVQTSL